MEGNTFMYGKSSPKFIADASLDFSFDIQRFATQSLISGAFATQSLISGAQWYKKEGENYFIYSITGGAAGGIASLTTTESAMWSLGAAAQTGASTESIVPFDLGNATFKTYHSVNAGSASAPLMITLTSANNFVVGGASGASIYDKGGNDTIDFSASSGKEDVYYYVSGADSIGGFNGTQDKIILDGSATSFKVANATTSTDSNNLIIDFGSNNKLTFGGAAASSVSITSGVTSGATTYLLSKDYIGGGSGITLTPGFTGGTVDASTAPYTSYDTIDASKVVTISGGLKIKGKGNQHIFGSDNVATSIFGGVGDSLYAGKGGATLNGGASTGGASLLVGNTGLDYFLYGGGTTSIQSYTYSNNEDVNDIVSLTSADLALPTATDSFKFASLSASQNNFNISLGSGGASGILTFVGVSKSPKIEIKEADGDIFHYEKDRVIVNNSRVTLNSLYTNKSFNANSYGEGMASIDALAITAKALNITGNTDTANSIIGAGGGGKIVGGTGNDYLKSGVTVGSGTGSSITTLDGGTEGNDTLVGNGGVDLFIYRGGTDSIGGYSSGQDSVQVIGFNMLSEDTKFASIAGHHLVLNLGTGSDSLTVAGGASESTVVTILNGSHNFVYNKGVVTQDSKYVTLTSDYKISSPYTLAPGSNIVAVDASVAGGTGTVKIDGSNANNGIRIIGSATLANSLKGSSGNDYLSGGGSTSNDVFIYTGGRDTVANYQYSATAEGSAVITTDSLVADGFVNDIASGKATSNRLIFTGSSKSSMLTFQFDDEVAPRISLGGGSGYLTKDGYVNTTDKSLNLFSNARGEIEFNTTPYSLTSGDQISSVNAYNVTQSVTLSPGASLTGTPATYILPNKNMQRDRFVYAGGAVSISGYEGGRDQLDLGIGFISGFSVTDNDVLISLNGSSSHVVSISGGKVEDFFIHQSNDGNRYRKMSFNQSGILTNKGSKPTTATVLGGAVSLDASSKAMGEGSLRKIVLRKDTGAISIQAGDKYNTIIDGKEVTGSDGTVSLYGGKKNDKLIGSTADDAKNIMFVYEMTSGTGGKDVVSNFSNGSDSISVVNAGNNPAVGVQTLLSGAKITTPTKGNSVTFKFNNKNSLALKTDAKGTETISSVNINGQDYTFGKNAFSSNSGGTVSLTSNFGGTFNTTKFGGESTTATVDGSQVKQGLTFRGSSSTAESLVGGQKKTTFYGGGGNDIFVGGSGKDVFVYTKNDTGDVTIADFDFKKDKLKIASGTIAKIESVSGGIQFNMNNSGGAAAGSFKISSSATYSKNDKTAGEAPSATNTVIKANNTYYWFAQSEITEQVTVGGESSTIKINPGDLITYDTRVSSGKIPSAVSVIDLGYSTNLVRAGVATVVSSTNTSATLPPGGGSGGGAGSGG